MQMSFSSKLLLSESSRDPGLFKNTIVRIILLTEFEKKNDGLESPESESNPMSILETV